MTMNFLHFLFVVPLTRLWAILAFIVSTDPHFKNPPEIVDHPGTSGILFSTYYALGHTYFNLTHCLGWLVWTLRRVSSHITLLSSGILDGHWGKKEGLKVSLIIFNLTL